MADSWCAPRSVPHQMCHRDFLRRNYLADAVPSMALMHPSMAGLVFCLCCSTVQSWNCHSRVVLLFATGRIKSRDLDLLKNLVMRRHLFPNSLCRIRRQPFWVHYQQSSAEVANASLQEGTGDRALVTSSELVHILQNLCEQGQLDNAMKCLLRMDQQGILPTVDGYRSLLKACIRRKALVQARRVHVHLVQHGLETTPVLGEYLVSTLVKCGGLEFALQVFHRLSSRTVFSWTALISGYVSAGQGHVALRVYYAMRDNGVQADKYTIVSLLQACGSIPDLKLGKQIHSEALKLGCQSELFVGTSLVDMYAKCGSIWDAQIVFNELRQRDVVSWNSILAAYAMQDQGEKVLDLYHEMQLERVSPNNRTFVSVFQACGMLAEKEDNAIVDGQSTKVKSLDIGKALHMDAQRKGCASDIFVANTLISMYGKCKSFLNAQAVFSGMAKRDVVSWNAMLMACTQQDQAERALHVYEEMLVEGVIPDVRTFLSALQACGILAEKEEQAVFNGLGIKLMSFEQGKKIHHNAWRSGFESHNFVGNTLVSMYGKCGSILDAKIVFDELSQRSVVSWTAIVMAYTQSGEAERALQLYEEMLVEGVSPDVRVFVSALQACGVVAENECEIGDEGVANAVAFRNGKVIHAAAWKLGRRSDVFIGSTLVSMYGKCGSICDAQMAFDELPERDLAAWNAMIAAYVCQGQAGMALQLYESMLGQGVHPDFWTYVRALQACGILAEEEEEIFMDGQSMKAVALNKGKEIHAAAQRMGCHSDLFVGNTLVCLYGKCGSLLDAQDVFNGLPYWNVVTWNSLLSAYTQHDQAEKALHQYEVMQNVGTSPNDRTFVSMIQACGLLAEMEDGFAVSGLFIKVKSFESGRAIHALSLTMGFGSDVFIRHTLVSMYGKCGSITDAQQLFDGLDERDVVAWNALLSANVEQGKAEDSLNIYRQMQEDGVRPNEITLMYILQACSNAGSLDVCVETHYAIVDSGLSLTPLLASALIHAYGQCASMADAQNVFDAMPRHDVVSWTTLIAGYAREGTWKTSLQYYETMRLTGVKPNGVTFLSLLSACTHGGLVNEGVEYFESMIRDHGLTPEIEHYATMVDLLGRAGYFIRIQALLSAMPMPPDLAIWLCLLGACRKHHEMLLGEQAFEHAVSLQPNHAAAYLLMANMYADAGLWNLAQEVHDRQDEAGARKKPGESWIRHQQRVHMFSVQDKEHPQVEQLYLLVDTLCSVMQKWHSSYTGNMSNDRSQDHSSRQIAVGV